MTDQQLIDFCKDSVPQIRAELNTCCDKLDRRAAIEAERQVSKTVAKLPKGSCVFVLLCDVWMPMGALPEGYTGRYYLAGEPFLPRYIETPQERMMTQSMYADHAKGGTLD